MQVSNFGDDQTSEPVFTTKALDKGLNQVFFNLMAKDTKYAYCGGFFCWTVGSTIQLHDLEANTRKEFSLKKSTELEFIQLDACEPRSLI